MRASEGAVETGVEDGSEQNRDSMQVVEESSEEDAEPSAEEEEEEGDRQDDDSDDDVEDDASSVEHGADEDEERQAQLDQELIHEFPAKVREMQQRLAAPGIGQDQELQARFIKDFQRFLPIPNATVQASVQPIENRNFLYRMASGFAGNVDAPWLVKHLVETYPDLLCELDQFLCSALLVAIIKERRGFINAVLDSKIGDGHLDVALASRSSNNENCIHIAVTKGPKSLDPAAVIRLIERASEETLAAQDNRDFTPLHRAVDYARCTASQVDVVKALIRCGDRAFDKFTGKPDCFSVYRYHIDTRRKYLQNARDSEKRSSKHVKSRATKATTATKSSTQPSSGPSNKLAGPQTATAVSSAQDRAVWETASGKPGNQTPTSKKPGEDRAWDDWEKIVSSEGTRRVKDSTGGEPQRLKRAPTIAPPSAGSLPSPTTKNMLPLAATTNQARGVGQHTISLVARHAPEMGTAPLAPGSISSADIAANDASAKPKRPKIGKSTKSSSKLGRDPAETPSPESADAIAKELKLHYLRSTFDTTSPSEQHRCRTDLKAREATQAKGGREVRTHNSAIDFLFGENKEGKFRAHHRTALTLTT